MAQSIQNYDPAILYVNPVTRVWATTGNTDTVTDPSIYSGSQIVIQNTSAYAGRWYVSNITPTSTAYTAGQNVTTPGTFTVTSSSSETQTSTTYSYTIV